MQEKEKIKKALFSAHDQTTRIGKVGEKNLHRKKNLERKI